MGIRSIKQLTYEYIAMNCRDDEVIETGFPLVDELVRVHPGDLIAIFAVEAMGGTSLLLSILKNVIEKYEDKSVLLVLDSHEGWVRNYEALLSIRTGIPRKKIGEKDVLSSMANELYKFSKEKIYIHEGTYTESELALLFDTSESEVIFIDGLQSILSPSFDNAEGNDFEDPPEKVDLSKALAHIKRLAREKKKTVFVSLSHPRRIVNHYHDHRPRIQDLRVYGKEMESVPDAVLFPFRPGYYDLEFSGKNEYHLAELIAYINGKGEYVSNLEWNRLTCEYKSIDHDRYCELMCQSDPDFKGKYNLIYGKEESDLIDVSGEEISESGFINLDDNENEIPF